MAEHRRVPKHIRRLTLAAREQWYLASRASRISFSCILPPLWSTGAGHGTEGGSGEWLPEMDRCEKNRGVGASHKGSHEMIKVREAQEGP